MEHELTLLILIIYLIVLAFIGILCSKKIKNTKSFFLANRSIGWFALTATLTATVVGGSATIATAKLIYINGLPSLWLDIGGAVGLIVLAFTLAKKVRKTGLFTLSEITGHLFDERVRFVSSILILISQIAWISLLIQGAGAVISVLLPLNDILPLNYILILIIITFIFIFYTILGGQFAVIYTDIIQFFVMILGVCFIAAPLLLIKALPNFGMIPSDHISFPINSNLGVLPVLSFFFMMLMPNIVGPDIYSKILSAKNEKIVKKGVILSGIFRFIFAITIALIALSAIVLVPGLEESEAVFAMPRAILLLGPVFAGIIFAAFVSVMLSSADSVLISSGTILTIDIIKRDNILISRIGMLIIGLLALGLALYLNNIINTLVLAYTIFTAGLTLPIIFGFYKNKTKVSSTGALISLISGGSVSLIWFFLKNPFRIDAVIIGLIASLVPLLIFKEKKNEISNT